MAFEYLFSNEQYKKAHEVSNKGFIYSFDGLANHYRYDYKNNFNWKTFNVSEVEKFRNFAKPGYENDFFQVKQIPDGQSYLEKNDPKLADEMIAKANDKGFQNYLTSWTKYHYATWEVDAIRNQTIKNADSINWIKNDIRQFENGKSPVQANRNWLQKRIPLFRFKENRYIRNLKSDLAEKELSTKNCNYVIGRLEKGIKADSEYIFKYERENRPFFERLENSYKKFTIEASIESRLVKVNSRVAGWEMPKFSEKTREDSVNSYKKDIEKSEDWEQPRMQKKLVKDEAWRAEKDIKDEQMKKASAFEQALQKHNEAIAKENCPGLQQPKFTFQGGIK